jgi:hypothetical protein
MYSQLLPHNQWYNSGDMPPDIHVSEDTIRWSAYEHAHIERGSDWFIALGVTTLAIALISILFHNVFFAILVILAAVIIWQLAIIPPEIIEFELSDKGIRVNGTLHRYREIISFWVEDEHNYNRPLLLVDTIKLMSPNIIIPIEDVDPSLVRAFLAERLTEVHMHEPISHKIFEFLGL